MEQSQRRNVVTAAEEAEAALATVEGELNRCASTGDDQGVRAATTAAQDLRLRAAEALQALSMWSEFDQAQAAIRAGTPTTPELTPGSAAANTRTGAVGSEALNDRFDYPRAKASGTPSHAVDDSSTILQVGLSRPPPQLDDATAQLGVHVTVSDQQRPALVNPARKDEEVAAGSPARHVDVSEARRSDSILCEKCSRKLSLRNLTKSVRREDGHTWP